MNGVGAVPVGRLELAPAVALEPEATLADVAAALASQGVPAVLVATEPPGLLTARDLVVAIADDLPLTTTARDLPLHEPCCVGEETTVAEAVVDMLEDGEQVVVVVDARNHPRGLLSLSAAIAALLSEPPWLGGLRLALHIEQRIE